MYSKLGKVNTTMAKLYQEDAPTTKEKTKQYTAAISHSKTNSSKSEKSDVLKLYIPASKETQRSALDSKKPDSRPLLEEMLIKGGRGI